MGGNVFSQDLIRLERSDKNVVLPNSEACVKQCCYEC